jgi:hypothetical protein
LLAKFVLPDTNPVGAGSLWPLGIVVATAVIQRLSGWRGLLLAAPAVFAVFALLCAGSPFAHYRRFPNADDHVGYYIWSLAACCFALKAARSGSLATLVYGGLVILPMGWLLVMEAASRSFVLMPGLRVLSPRWLELTSSFIWCVLFAALMYHAALPLRRAARIGRGLCGRCGYDVRASPAKCPECGQTPDWRR